MKPLCIYHGGCDDGFAAAYAVRKAVSAEFYPGRYGEAPPDCSDRDVYIVDFSYKRDVLEQVADQAKHVTVIDHHISAQRDLEALKGNKKVTLYFDMKHSGAVLTWRYFHPNEVMPQLFEYIEDRDLWRFDLPNTAEFIMALRSYPKTFEQWEELIARGAPALIMEGRSILRFYKAKCAEIEKAAHSVQLGPYTVKACNAPWFMASDVAGALDGEFGVCYWRNYDGSWAFSLRSRGEFDVSRVAEGYGGGGHKNAAGFKLDVLPW